MIHILETTDHLQIVTMNSPSSPTLKIIIVAYDSETFLPDCLHAIAGQTTTDFEVLIIDNGGADTPSGYHRIDLPDARFTHVQSAENDGFAGGFARGADGAVTDLLMSVNPDCMLDSDCIERLIDAWQTKGKPVMLSPVLYASPGRTVIDGLGDSLSVWGIPWRNGYGHIAATVDLSDICDVFAPSGAAALYDRRAYDAAGGMDPDFFCYLEDVDLGLRLRARGGRCLLVRDARGVHTGGHSTTKMNGFATTYLARNGLALIVKSAPILLLPLMIGLYVCGQIWLLRHGRREATVAFRAEGNKRALKSIGKAVMDRLRSKPYPLGASYRVARRLHWGRSGFRDKAVLTWPVDD